MTDSTTQASGQQSPLDELPDIYTQFRGSSGGVVELVTGLLDNLESINLDRSEILMAFELTRMEPDCTEEDRINLILLILASMVAKRRGSVRFSLVDGSESGASLSVRLKEHLSGLLDVLRESDLDFESIDRGESFWTKLADGARSLKQNPDDYCLLGSAQDETPLVLTADQLYHQRSFAKEKRLADYLEARIITDRPERIPNLFLPDTDAIRDGMELVCELSTFDLTPKQQYGILTATCAPLSLITGGPGTGKTSIVLSLFRLLVELGVSPEEIAIAAPTGKAANRLGESLTEGLAPEKNPVDRTIVDEFDDPSTLHRLLGYSKEWESFYYHENRPLPHRYVIVDEASMIDLSLMEQLVSAVADSAALCLLGDADQLPAVESGAVFRDLVPSQEHTDVPWEPLPPNPFEQRLDGEKDPLNRQAIRLDENFRVQGGDSSMGNLVRVAETINQGGENLTFTNKSDATEGGSDITVCSRFEQLSFQGVELLNPSGGNEPEPGNGGSDRSFADLLRRWYDRWLENELYDVLSGGATLPNQSFPFREGRPDGCTEQLNRIFEGYNRAQLLSVTRRTPLGTENINQILHRYHRRTQKLFGADTSRYYLPGEPIIMMRNDYDRRLFNGEQGLVLLVEQPSNDEPKPMAVFPRIGGYQAYHLGPLRSELNHAFALTVHKSQGSEYGSVGIVLPQRDVPLMTRELLYTAVTRAQYGSTFFGTSQRLRDGAKRKDERNSGLIERLENRE